MIGVGAGSLAVGGAGAGAPHAARISVTIGTQRDKQDSNARLIKTSHQVQAATCGPGLVRNSARWPH